MDLFVAGEVVKTRGLRGCVKISLQLETQDTVRNLESVCLEDISGRRKFYKIKRLELSGKFLFLDLENISDVASAKALVGSKVLISVNKLKKLPAGEYYWRDIIGLVVYDEDGKYLGRIESIFPTGSNDVYVCQGAREILLPAIADVVRHIDIDKHIMTVKLPDGL